MWPRYMLVYSRFIAEEIYFTYLLLYDKNSFPTEKLSPGAITAAIGALLVPEYGTSVA